MKEDDKLEAKKVIENQTFDEERALYNLKDTEVNNGKVIIREKV